MLSTRARAFSRSFIAALAVLAIAAGITLTAPAQQASAASITLCTGYVQCAAYGMSNHGYAGRAANSYWRMYGGHNGTNYAAYMMVGAGMPNVRPWTNATGDARGWGVGYAKATNQTPAVGSIAWWTSGSGHVAYVEAVLSPTEILISEDSWGGDFHWRYISKDTGGWPVGFIHFKDATGVGGVREYMAKPVSTTVWTSPSKTYLATPTVMNPGSTAWVEVKYLNTGRSTWTGLSLATQSPDDHASPIAQGWPAVGRAATQTEASVAPGRSATFGFAIRIPAGLANGTPVKETFSPVLPDGTRVLYGNSTLSLVADSRSVFLAQPAPLIRGNLVEKTVITAAPGTWPATATLSYQWRRNGVAITGAKASTYALTDADVGRTMTVAVTASAPNYLSATKVSGVSRVVTSQWSDRLLPGAKLKAGEQIVAANGAYRMYQRGDGILVLQNRLTAKIIWRSKSAGVGGYTMLTDSGRIVGYTAAGKVTWRSQTQGKGVTAAIVTSNATFRLVNSAGSVLWIIR